MKISKKERNGHVFFFLVFLLPFIFGGALLIWLGYNKNDNVSLVFGIISTCIGLSQISQKYKARYIFLAIPVLFAVGCMIGIPIFILFYMPFFYKESLAIDLHVLVLKDWFVRTIMIIIDILILFNLLAYCKKRIKSIATKNKRQ